MANATQIKKRAKVVLCSPKLDQFKICAMELVDSLTPSGELVSQPFWQYGIRCTHGTKELIWLEEEALVRIAPDNPDWF